MKRLAATALVCLAACAGPTANSKAPSHWTEAAGTTQDTRLAELCALRWEQKLEYSPVWATRLGDARYYGKLTALTPAQRAHRLETKRRTWRGANMIDPASLSAEDRITLALILEELELEIAEDSHPLTPYRWNLNGLGGPQIEYLSLAADQPHATARERTRLLERWGRMSSAITRAGEDLREGVAAGQTAPRHSIETVIDQLDAVLATPACLSPLLEPATGPGRWVKLEAGETTDERLLEAGLTPEELEVLRFEGVTGGENEGWTYLPAANDRLPLDERAEFVEESWRIVHSRVYPALQRYRDLIATEILPFARSDENPGFGELAGGLDYYAIQVRRHTSLDLSPEEIHQIGLDELVRIHAEMREIGERQFGTGDLAEIQDQLRNDPALHFETAEEIVATAAACVARAEAAVPTLFGVLPEAPCEVLPVPAHEAPDTTIAYYREPAPDGSRPGRYYVNTYAPTTRPRYEAEVLAYHEAVPGHHTQVAIAQGLRGLPLVRRHGGVTAYVEGWALYTERLCEELGLYTSDLDRLGVLSFDSWRASRLVVDTGIHAFGWSRERAIEFLIHNTLLAPNNCANEVDRYIAWPGQALAYKLGQREILALRAESEAALGGAFALSDFHDVVLGSGAVSLGALRTIVEAWVASGGGDPSAELE